MRHRRTVIAAGVTLAVLLGGGGVWAAGRDDRPEPGSTERDTATVERTSLSAGLNLNGRLGYGTPTVVPAAQEGVITALPTAGDVIGAGQTLYGVDGRPVVVLHGGTPLWRDLGMGDSGADVAAVRTALAELGYPVGDPAGDTFDQELSAALGAFYRDRGYPEPTALPGAEEARLTAVQERDTAAAELARAQAALEEKRSGPTAGERAQAEATVSAAQRDLARAQAGEEGAPGVAEADEALRTAQAQLSDLDAPVDTTAEVAAVTAAQTALDVADRAATRLEFNGIRAAEVVMVPTDAVRVDSVVAVVGQSGGDAVLRWTGVSVRAYATLTAGQARQIATGTAARVTLPDGTEVEGTVAAVEPAGQDGEGQATDPRLVVDLADQEALATAGLASVRIGLPSETVDDALVVPVTALLALAEGGYALEVVDPDDAGRTTLVPVEVGLITEARAQVITDQVDAGATVVIP